MSSLLVIGGWIILAGGENSAPEAAGIRELNEPEHKSNLSVDAISTGGDLTTSANGNWRADENSELEPNAAQTEEGSVIREELPWYEQRGIAQFPITVDAVRIQTVQGLRDQIERLLPDDPRRLKLKDEDVTLLLKRLAKDLEVQRAIEIDYHKSHDEWLVPPKLYSQRFETTAEARAYLESTYPSSGSGPSRIAAFGVTPGADRHVSLYVADPNTYSQLYRSWENLHQSGSVLRDRILLEFEVLISRRR